MLFLRPYVEAPQGKRGVRWASGRGSSKPPKAVTEYGSYPLAKVPSGLVVMVKGGDCQWRKVVAQTPCFGRECCATSIFRTVNVPEPSGSGTLAVLKLAN